jgi:hypothetical protein
MYCVKQDCPVGTNVVACVLTPCYTVKEGRAMMADRTTIGIRMDPQALARLDALCAKLGLNRTAVMLLALARLAELEHVDTQKAA